MSGEKKSFIDPGDNIRELMDEILVRCPRCDGRAFIRYLGAEFKTGFGPHRIVCDNCGYNKDWDACGYSIPGDCEETALDPYLDCPLWLQKRCAGHTLWAFNARHLKLLRDFVEADFRKTKRPTGCMCFGSVAWSLPKWICQAKNRETILKTIEELTTRV